MTKSRASARASGPSSASSSSAPMKWMKAGGHQPVLGLAASGEQVLADLDRKQLREVEIADVSDGHRALRADVRLAAEENRRTLLLPQATAVERCRGGRADGNLAGFGHGLHLDGRARGGAGDDELPVQVADEEEVEGAAVDANRHPQRDEPRRGAQLAGRPHLRCMSSAARQARASCSGAVEQEQDGVATPLDHAGALGVGDRQQLGEAVVEQVVHLLGADLALLREPLGERGEARDVDEGKRPLDLLVSRVRRLAQPLDRDSRHVRRQAVGSRDAGLRRSGRRSGHRNRLEVYDRRRRYDQRREGRHPRGRLGHTASSADTNHEQAPAADLRPADGHVCDRGARRTPASTS